jgi:hypothetical protein
MIKTEKWVLPAMARVAGEQRKNFENETTAAAEAFREQKRMWRVVLLTSSGIPLGGIRRQGGIELFSARL